MNAFDIWQPLPLLYFGALAAGLVIAAVYFFVPHARKIGLLDTPTERKQHEGQIPLLGGPVISFIFLLGLCIARPGTNYLLILTTAFLVLVGAWDDLRGLRWTTRLVAQVCVAVIFVQVLQISINDLGFTLWKFESLDFSLAHKLLAVLAIVLTINAFNMLDGIDGLCALSALLVIQHTLLSALILTDIVPENAELSSLLLTDILPERLIFTSLFLSGCLVGFLVFNLQRSSARKIFLGDSGSMFLGLIISVLLISVFGGNISSDQPYTIDGYPILALWILAMPVADISNTAIRRVIAGRSPFAADRSHLHHKIMDAGATPLQTLSIITFCSIFVFWIGFYITFSLGNKSSLIGFFIFLFLVGFFPKIVKNVIQFFQRNQEE